MVRVHATLAVRSELLDGAQIDEALGCAATADAQRNDAAVQASWHVWRLASQGRVDGDADDPLRWVLDRCSCRPWLSWWPTGRYRTRPCG